MVLSYRDQFEKSPAIVHVGKMRIECADCGKVFKLKDTLSGACTLSQAQGSMLAEVQ